MVYHYPIIPTLTSYLDQNFLQQVLPFFLKPGCRDALLPFNVLVLRLQVRHEFHIICDSGFKPAFPSPWELCHFSYQSFIHLELFSANYYLWAIKCESKGFCHLLMRSMDFYKTYSSPHPWTVEIPMGVILGSQYHPILFLGHVLLSSFFGLFLYTCKLKIRTLENTITVRDLGKLGLVRTHARNEKWIKEGVVLILRDLIGNCDLNKVMV